MPKKHIEIRTSLSQGIEKMTRVKLAQELGIREEDLPEYEIEKVTPVGQEGTRPIYYVEVSVSD